MSDKKEKFFYMTLKKRTGRGGAIFYSAKYAYAIDVVGFEKKDGSGDITLWLSPRDMDEMKNKGFGQQQQQKPQAPPPQQRQAYAPPQRDEDMPPFDEEY